MTEARKNGHRRLIWLLAVSALLFCLSEQKIIINGAREGIRLCLESIIPTLFPFMIFADLLSASAAEGQQGPAAWTFCRIFRTQKIGFHAFVLGALGGFPLGAREVCRAYKRGELTASEAQHLLGFVNVTGPAFLIAGVGAALRGSAAEGLALYAIQIISAALTGYFTAPRKRRNGIEASVLRAPFSLPSSIASSTMSLLVICGTITFFSAVGSLINFLLPENISVFLLAFAEITSGTDAIVDILGTQNLLSFALTCASVSFGGVCVGTQCAVYIREAGLSMISYYKGKVLCAALAFLLGAGVWAMGWLS